MGQPQAASDSGGGPGSREGTARACWGQAADGRADQLHTLLRAALADQLGEQSSWVQAGSPGPALLPSHLPDFYVTLTRPAGPFWKALPVCFHPRLVLPVRVQTLRNLRQVSRDTEAGWNVSYSEPFKLMVVASHEPLLPLYLPFYLLLSPQEGRATSLPPLPPARLGGLGGRAGVEVLCIPGT